MSGIGLVLDIAKSALLSQQYAIDVTSHNIANASTEGYSRQRVELQAKKGDLYAGVLLGRGVRISDITRIADQFIEARIANRESDAASLEATEHYMAILEGVFNETSGNGLTAHLAAFWNAWHDLSNNPSGDPERAMLQQRGDLLAEAFNTLNADVTEFVTELTQSIIGAVEKINEITAAIAELNNQIVGMEMNRTAHDLRDQRNVLLNQLSEYINNKWFEQENGSVTVIAGKGNVLVLGNESYNMYVDGLGVKLETSGDSSVDLTDSITGGKLGGWLDIRDEIVPKYQADLDALAKSLIGEVNKIHSQGVGLHFFDSAITGTYATDTTGALDTLDFGHEIDYSKDLTIWINDNNGTADPADDVLNSITVTFNMGDTITDLVTQINAAGAGVTASGTTALTLTPDSANYTYAFSDNDSHILAALGINTFFQGNNASSMAVNSVIENNDHIAAGKIDPLGNFAVGDNRNALNIADLQYKEVSIQRWTYSRGSDPTSAVVLSTLEDYYHTSVSSLGIKSESITRGREFHESIVDKLTEIRDSISAVSLDEEMANLIKSQHAYAAAAKLVTISDEMFTTLLGTTEQ